MEKLAKFRTVYSDLYAEFYGSVEIPVAFVNEQFRLLNSGVRDGRIGDNSFEVWRACGWDLY